jgi:hypothetical protein
MTTQHLYAIYAGAYADASHFHDEGDGRRASDFTRRRDALSSVERTIVALAVHDATNGTPRRSPWAFGRAIREGGPLLGRIGGPSGVRLEPG